MTLTALAVAAALSGSPGQGFDAVAYTVALTPDFAGRSLTGESRLELRRTTDALREIVLTGNALTIDRAFVDDRAIAPVLAAPTWSSPCRRSSGAAARPRCGSTTTGHPAAA